MKTLKTFLEKHDACKDGFKFSWQLSAKDLTLKEFLETCERSGWILWLFARTNPESLKELTLAKAHCANTVRRLMTNPRSLNAVDVAIKFGEGKATKEELAKALIDAKDFANPYNYPWAGNTTSIFSARYSAAKAAAYAADISIFAADMVGHCANSAADSAVYYAADNDDDYSAATKKKQKQTADICRKFLPIEIWDQSQF